jgi:hypothetical protein
MLPSSTLPPLKWKLEFQKKVGACAALIEGCTAIIHLAPQRLGDRATPRAPFVAWTLPALQYCRGTLLCDHSSPSSRPPLCVGRRRSTSTSPSSSGSSVPPPQPLPPPPPLASTTPPLQPHPLLATPPPAAGPPP